MIAIAAAATAATTMMAAPHSKKAVSPASSGATALHRNRGGKGGECAWDQVSLFFCLPVCMFPVSNNAASQSVCLVCVMSDERRERTREDQRGGGGARLCPRQSTNTTESIKANQTVSIAHAPPCLILARHSPPHPTPESSTRAHAGQAKPGIARPAGQYPCARGLVCCLGAAYMDESFLSVALLPKCHPHP